MNYWINKIVFSLGSFTLITITIPSVVYGQLDTVIVSFQTIEAFFENPVSKELSFTFIEDGKTCGPNGTFADLQEQYLYFLEQIDSVKNDITISERPERWIPVRYTPKKRISVLSNDTHTLDFIKAKAQFAFADRFSFGNYFGQFNPRLEAKIVLERIAKLQQQAKAIAEHLGKENCKIKNVCYTNGNTYDLKIRQSTGDDDRHTNLIRDQLQHSFNLKAEFLIY